MRLEVINGKYSYKNGRTHVFSDINLSLPQGKILTILGSNGVGKTTLIKCILGIFPWQEGETKIDEVNIKSFDNRSLWKRIGYVPQAKLSAFSYSVEEMVLLGRSAHIGLLEQPDERDREIAERAMEDIGISHLKHKSCGAISGGELQMVLIARALAGEPELLVLDEPESNLDFKNQKIVLKTIEELCRTRNISAIINTHYPEHAIKLSDYALLLKKSGGAIWGPGSEVLNEENLKAIFDVDIKVRDIMLTPDISYTCVIPM